MRRSLVSVLALSILLVAAVAMAADLYSLDMRFCAPDPGGNPDLMIEVYKGKTPDNLKGTATATWNGASYDIECDDIACITDIFMDDGNICVDYTALGYKDGKFEADSYFIGYVAGVSSGLRLHTSCSRIIRMDSPYGGDPFGSGTFMVLGGTSNDTDCLVEHMYCPPDPDKLYWIQGKFNVPCTAPADMTLNLYKDDDELKGTATATFDMGLTNVMNDLKIEFNTSGYHPDGRMVIGFTAFGQKDDGKFESNSRFELIVDGCGTFYLDQHTSCSRDIPKYVELETGGTPGGGLIWENCCGPDDCCTGETPVENRTWGTIKSLYR
jgi:hypothetical protein